MHGWMGDKNWGAPRRTVTCGVSARPGYSSCKAHEYQDEPEVLRQKVALLARLIKQSKTCVAYTGAGISTAAGIADYATQGEKSKIDTGRARVHTPWDAAPTLAHHTLAALHRHPQKFVKHWVQQNHDGLPQKAGYPQHALNEIHGAWYDPSNPVVRMSGSLRDDLFKSMLRWEQEADLCLTLGTSLAGMNADRIAISTAQRAIREMEAGNVEGSGGMVIVGLQCTQHDSLSSLRIFARIDQVMKLLAHEMDLHELMPNLLGQRAEEQHSNSTEHIFALPHDPRTGRRTEDGKTLMSLDLSLGQALRITSGPYADAEGRVVGLNREGHYKMRFRIPLPASNQAKAFKAPFELILGKWWPYEAERGLLDTFPVVNCCSCGDEEDKGGAEQEPECQQQAIQNGGQPFPIEVGSKFLSTTGVGTVVVTGADDVAIIFELEAAHDFEDEESKRQPATTTMIKGRKWFMRNYRQVDDDKQ